MLLNKMLGLDGLDIASLGQQLLQGIAEYNAKFDLILRNQEKIMQKLGIESEIVDVEIKGIENGSCD